MQDMLIATDAVVVAHPISFEPGRVIGDSRVQQFAYYGVLTLDVDRVLRGTSPSTIALEISAVEPGIIDDMAKYVPSERAVFFLRNKATSARKWGAPPGSTIEAEAKYWRLVSSQGLYRDFNGEVAAPVNAEAPYAIRADGAAFDSLVRAIESGDLAAFDAGAPTLPPSD